MKKAKAIIRVFLLVFGAAGIVHAAVLDNFDSYPDGVLLNDTANWSAYVGDKDTAIIAAGAGLHGSNGVGPGYYSSIMSDGDMLIKNRVQWSELPVGISITLSMDYQTDDAGEFDDDRLGMTLISETIISDSILAVQLNGTVIEAYYDGVDTANQRPQLASFSALEASTFYTFTVRIIKLGDKDVMIKAVLNELDGSLVAAGSMNTTLPGTFTGSELPNPKYFTNEMYPAFKNYNEYADNFSFEISISDENQPSELTVDNVMTMKDMVSSVLSAMIRGNIDPMNAPILTFIVR